MKTTACLTGFRGGVCRRTCRRTPQTPRAPAGARGRPNGAGLGEFSTPMMISLNKPLSTNGLFSMGLFPVRFLNGNHPSPRGVKAVHPHTPTHSIDPDPSLVVSKTRGSDRIRSEPKRTRGACILPIHRCSGSQGPKTHPKTNQASWAPRVSVPRILYCCAAEITGGQCGFASTSDDDLLGRASCHPQNGKDSWLEPRSSRFREGTLTHLVFLFFF